MVHRCRLQPPQSTEVETAPWLIGEGRDRDAVLKGDPVATNRLQAQGGGQFRRGLRTGAGREQEPEYDVSQDETGEPVGTAQRGALSASRSETAGLEMALLQQVPDRLSPFQLERGSRNRRAIGGVPLPNDSLDPRDDRR